MPSDTPIYDKDGKRLMVSRRAYEGIYKDRGYRLRPPKDDPEDPSPSPDDDAPSPDGDQQSNQEE